MYFGFPPFAIALVDCTHALCFNFSVSFVIQPSSLLSFSPTNLVTIESMFDHGRNLPLRMRSMPIV